jgi:hypothetical protein
MFGLSDISIQMPNGVLILLLGFVGALLFSVWYYRYTLPPISNVLKAVLIFLRFLGVFLIFLLLLNPVMRFSTKEEVKPVNLVFIDNSSSMLNSDSMKTREKIVGFIQKIINDKKYQSRIFLFDKTLNRFSNDGFDSLNFKGVVTNFEPVFKKISELEDSVQNVIILTDGNPTEGEIPNYVSEQINVPIYTVGVGDTIEPPNIEIGNVLTNGIIHKNDKTPISITILSNGIRNKSTVVAVYLNGKLQEKKNINIGKEGITKVGLHFTPVKLGRNRLSVVVGKVKGEQNIFDNRKIVYVDVIKKKKNIVFITDSPSYDFEFIKRAVQSDTNNSVQEFVNYLPSSNIIEQKFINIIKSSDAIFMINYPLKRSSRRLWKKISQAINYGKPFYLLLTSQTNSDYLKSISTKMGFRFNNNRKTILQAQPVVPDKENPIFSFNGVFPETIWDNLSPVNFIKVFVKFSPVANYLIKTKINNRQLDFPLMISAVTDSKSMTLFAESIWKWKLQSSLENSKFFDEIFVKSTKWLTADKNQDRLKINLPKNVFTQDESIKIFTQVYDPLFNLTSRAKLFGTVRSKSFKSVITFGNIRKGEYKTEIPNLAAGNYRVNVTAILEGDTLKGNGKFTVESFNAEKIKRKVNSDLLRRISFSSEGEFVFLNNSDKISDVLKQNYVERDRTKNIDFVLFPSLFLLFFIIFVFSLEWILRKKNSLI